MTQNYKGVTFTAIADKVHNASLLIWIQLEIEKIFGQSEWPLEDPIHTTIIETSKEFVLKILRKH